MFRFNNKLYLIYSIVLILINVKSVLKEVREGRSVFSVQFDSIVKIFFVS